MAKEEDVEFEGEVVEALSNGKYRVALDNGYETRSSEQAEHPSTECDRWMRC